MTMTYWNKIDCSIFCNENVSTPQSLSAYPRGSVSHNDLNRIQITCDKNYALSSVSKKIYDTEARHSNKWNDEYRMAYHAKITKPGLELRPGGTFCESDLL